MTLIISYPLKPFSKHDVDAKGGKTVLLMKIERGEREKEGRSLT